jgi:lactoylglutathione lyase
MKVSQHGIILFVEHYEQCVRFYSEVLGLRIAYAKDMLTSFEFGSSYLMVESGGVASSAEKSIQQNPTVLRFNVEDIRSAAHEIEARGVAVELLSFEWGDIGVFTDPDGNRCELKNAV